MTRAAQEDSAPHRVTTASSADLDSPYAPSPPNMPRLGEPGSTTCNREAMSRSEPIADSPPTSRSTAHSRTFISISERDPASERSPATRGAANGNSMVGVWASLMWMA